MILGGDLVAAWLLVVARWNNYGLHVYRNVYVICNFNYIRHDGFPKVRRSPEMCKKEALLLYKRGMTHLIAPNLTIIDLDPLTSANLSFVLQRMQ